jgi:hypothetical protein
VRPFSITPAEGDPERRGRETACPPWSLGRGASPALVADMVGALEDEEGGLDADELSEEGDPL